MRAKKNERCYNCGKRINDKIKSKEHIPAIAFYVGYTDEYKLNRIVLPACRNCNEKYSKTDQELRDAIGISNNNDEAAIELTKKSTRSIMRSRDGRGRLYFDVKGKVAAVEFKYDDFKTSVTKDFRGIFFEEYGYPLPKNWNIDIIADFEDEEKLNHAALEIAFFLHQEKEWSKSGHVDIFKYKIKMISEIEGEDRIVESKEINSAITIASIQCYHDRVGFVVVASKYKLLKKNRNQPIRVIGEVRNKKSKKTKKRSSMRKSYNKNRANKIERNCMKRKKKGQ